MAFFRASGCTLADKLLISLPVCFASFDTQVANDSLGRVAVSGIGNPPKRRERQPAVSPMACSAFSEWA